MIVALRWVGFVAGLVLSAGTVVGVMKTFIVPRRAWALIPSIVGRYGFQLFHATAVRMRSFDLADRFLGFLAPVVIIGILSSFLASFVVAFALLLLPWAELTLSEALRESGSSVFTLGFASTDEAVPIALDILAGATGMIFVTLTISYLPTLYGEVTKREVLVKQLEGWTGVPAWGPTVLAAFATANALSQLPDLYRSWDSWAAQVADTHMKYPVLTHFRLPRAQNHWLVALLAVMDAAAIEIALRPDGDHATARLLLKQGLNTLQSVAYPMRRIEPHPHHPGIDKTQFQNGLDRIVAAGYPTKCQPDDAWKTFAELRSPYAPLAYQLTYWTIAAPAPWTGDRAGFPTASTAEGVSGPQGQHRAFPDGDHRSGDSS